MARRAKNGKAAREKGRRFELEVVKLLENAGFKARRGRQSDLHHREDAGDPADVVGSYGGSVVIVAECKAGFRFDLEPALKQLKDAQEAFGTALPFIAVQTQREGRRDRRIAVVDLERFGALLQQALIRARIEAGPPALSYVTLSDFKP